ncbi:hypothetical protein V1264_024247 [Littorina saxatilis]|uniref:Ig-like domain-containing protein n=2 Tax=Littorina saxatilis TaxID=31220 RepID=A0AAN9AME4_9CAEN
MATRGTKMHPPLPSVSRVDVDSTLSTDSAQIAVLYLAPEKPHVSWFVDGFPIPENRLDFSMINHYEGWGSAILTLSRDKGRQFSVCLQNVVGQVCLQLQPLPENQVVTENTDFPWPLLVPAPLARYRPGQNVRVHAPELTTVHNYTYSVLFLSHDPSQSHAALVRASSRDMEGGQDGDVVTITPVTSGIGGWMVEVETVKENYEGVLIISTAFNSESQLVKSYTVSRPVTTYRRDHTDPFYPGFVAMVTQDQQTLPWRCRPGFDCLVTCPFVSNGDVTVTLSSMRSGGFIDQGEETESVGTVWRLGEYYGKARFVIGDFRSERDAGTYLCRASTESKTVVTSVVVN